VHHLFGGKIDNKFARIADYSMGMSFSPDRDISFRRLRIDIPVLAIVMRFAFSIVPQETRATGTGPSKAAPFHSI
jgi:hypothetical protein